MKWLLIVLAVVLLVAVIVVVIGYALPQAHKASVRARYRQPPDSIYSAIIDVENGPSWRTGLERVEVLDRELRRRVDLRNRRD